MAEATQLVFSHQEVVTALLKNQGIHEGIWGLAINFGFGAGNMGPNNGELNPTGIVSIFGVGIQKFPELNALSVDAAVVNPSDK